MRRSGHIARGAGAWLVFAAVCMLPAAPVAADATAPRRPDSPGRYEIRFESLTRDASPMTIHLFRDGAAVANHHVLDERRNTVFRQIDVSGLRFEGDRLAGVLRFEKRTSDRGPADTYEYALAVPFAGEPTRGRVRGTVTYVNHDAKQPTPIERAMTSAWTARLRTWAQLSAENPIRDGYDWPRWQGPNSNCSAIEIDAALVDDLNDARLVWKSEAAIPGARAGDARSPRPRDPANISGGFASPVVADGRVYQWYYEPAGDAVHKAVRDRHRAAGGMGSEQWRIEADCILLCIDATNGRTLWKRRFPRSGINYQAFNKGGPQLTCVVDGGRVFAVSSGGYVHAVDAASGAVLWRSNIGQRHTMQEHLRQTHTATQTLMPVNRDFGAAPTVADNVVVVNTQIEYKGGQRIESNGLIGLDGDTGRPLWKVPRSIGWASSPLRWDYEGRQYVVSAGRQRAVCVEPKTGRVLWEVDAPGNRTTPAVSSDGYLVCNVRRGDASHLAAFRITPQGATRAWQLPAEYGYPSGGSPVIAYGSVYARVKPGKFGKRRLIRVDLARGEVLAERPYSTGNGFTLAVGGRLLCDRDNSHDADDVHMFDAMTLEQKGEQWAGPNTTSYSTPNTPAIVDGRLFMRYRNGILCYDLRASEE